MSDTRNTSEFEVIDRPLSLGIRVAMFDYDGTISLVREGWQTVMLDYFCEELSKVIDPNIESPETLQQHVRAFIDKLTGKPTIYQCLQLAEELKQRGGAPLAPEVYQDEYLRRLYERIDGRVEQLANGLAQPDDFIVPGARMFLQRLHDAGVIICLASGTDEVSIRKEIELLQLTHFFNGGIFGAKDDQAFSKAQVIEHLFQTYNISGSELLGFGDGRVETENVRSVGGYPVGLATIEDAPGTGVNESKRRQLIQAGAKLIIPDFSNTDCLFSFLAPLLPTR